MITSVLYQGTYAVYTLLVLLVSTFSLKKNRYMEVLFLLLIIFFCFLISVRDKDLGIDTITYMNIFESLDFNLYPLEIDPLFKALIYLLHIISADGQFFIFICYIIINTAIIIALRKLEPEFWMLTYSIFLASFLFYNLHFNILRQGLSIAFGLLCLACYKQREYVRTIVFFTISIFFHASAFVLFGFLFFSKIKSLKKYFIVTFILVLLFSFYNPVVELARILSPYYWVFDKFYQYTTWSYGQEFTFRAQYILTIFLLILSMFLKRKIKDDIVIEKLDFYIKSLLYGFILISVFSFDEMVADRLFYIFFFFNFSIIANLYYKFVNKSFILMFLFFTMFILWMYKVLYIQFPVWFVYKTYMG